MWRKKNLMRISSRACGPCASLIDKRTHGRARARETITRLSRAARVHLSRARTGHAIDAEATISIYALVARARFHLKARTRAQLDKHEQEVQRAA